MIGPSEYGQVPILSRADNSKIGKLRPFSPVTGIYACLDLSSSFRPSQKSKRTVKCQWGKSKVNTKLARQFVNIYTIYRTTLPVYSGPGQSDRAKPCVLFDFNNDPRITLNLIEDLWIVIINHDIWPPHIVLDRFLSHCLIYILGWSLLLVFLG